MEISDIDKLKKQIDNIETFLNYLGYNPELIKLYKKFPTSSNIKGKQECNLCQNQ